MSSFLSSHTPSFSAPIASKLNSKDVYANLLTESNSLYVYNIPTGFNTVAFHEFLLHLLANSTKKLPKTYRIPDIPLADGQAIPEIISLRVCISSA